MRHLILAAIGLFLAAVPAHAQPRHDHQRSGVHRHHAAPPAAHRPQAHRPPHTHRPHAHRPSHTHRPHAHHHRWSSGQRFGDWRRHSAVRDYHRYGLRRPGRGQQWIKVNNDFLLISTASGVIAGIMAGR